MIMLRRLIRHRRNLPLLAEAALWLGLAWLALHLLPFPRVVARLCPPLGPRRATDEVIGPVVWAVRTAARWVPWPAVCFPQAIAAQRMLCRRGVAAILVYGVTKGMAGELNAHVWVEAGGRPVLGETATPFTEVTRWPAG